MASENGGLAHPHPCSNLATGDVTGVGKPHAAGQKKLVPLLARAGSEHLHLAGSGIGLGSKNVPEWPKVAGAGTFPMFPARTLSCRGGIFSTRMYHLPSSSFFLDDRDQG